MTITGATRFAIPAEVVARDVGGEVMILHLGTAIYFGLNDVGSRIWRLIETQQAVDAVCAAVADEFDAPPDVVRTDVVALATQLVDKGLLTPV
jgi:hypothetical protein